MPKLFQKVPIDKVYKLCLAQARQSPCGKMKFGAVLLDRDGLFYGSACNRPIAPLRHICTPTSNCVRFDIQSRTHSMLGSCGHAEEWLLKIAREMDLKLFDFNLYIAGTYPNGFPLPRHDPEFTCIRCAVQMWMHELGNIWMYDTIQEIWWRQSSYEAVQTAYAYASSVKVTQI